jgi:hypothetical protein
MKALMLSNKFFLSFLGFLMLVGISDINAQKPIQTNNEDVPQELRIAKIEGGLGMGAAGEGMGFTGRLAVSYIANRWGGLARVTSFQGDEASRRSWFGGRPREHFNDKAILLSRVISDKTMQTIASAGIGWMSGRKLNDEGTGLIDAGPDAGFAFEIGMATKGSKVGLGLGLIGNINSDSNLFGFVISLNVGFEH